MIRRNLIYFKLVLFPFLITFNLSAQQFDFGKDSLSILQSSPQEFDEWLQTKLNTGINIDLSSKVWLQSRSEVEHNLGVLEKAIYTRVNKHLFISDDAFITFTEYLAEYDKAIILTTRSNAFSIDSLKSINFIDSTLHIIYKRPLLKIKLLESRYHIVDDNISTKYNSSIRHFSELTELSDSIRKTIVLSHAKASYRIGEKLLRQNKPKEAEPYLVEVMTYPYYQEVDRKMVHDMFDLSVEAGRKVLELRSDNLIDLQNTRFVPAAGHILNPIKDDLIAKLKAKNEKK